MFNPSACQLRCSYIASRIFHCYVSFIIINIVFHRLYRNFLFLPLKMTRHGIHPPTADLAACFEMGTMFGLKKVSIANRFFFIGRLVLNRLGHVQPSSTPRFFSSNTAITIPWRLAGTRIVTVGWFINIFLMNIYMTSAPPNCRHKLVHQHQSGSRSCLRSLHWVLRW